jgi:hypothetical protein
VDQVVSLFSRLYLPSLPPAPLGFVETLYLAANPDIEILVRSGLISSGFKHWVSVGKNEGRRLMPIEVPDWIYEAGIIDPPK